jgi:hypothetical protein
MLIRVRNFGAAHGQLFPTTSTVHGAFAIVAAEVDQLESLDVTERLASHAARGVRKIAARKSLIEFLTRAKKVARVLATGIPELADDLDLPQPLDDPLLITVARQFAAAATAHAAQFAAHGIATSELDQRTEALEAALDQKGVRREAQVQSRALLDRSLARALEAVKMLDVAVPNHLAADAAMLATWKHERAITRSRRARDEANPPSPDQPDASQPAPVVPLLKTA